MDPHSLHSQYNQRPPKSKALSISSRAMDQPKPSLNGIPKRPGVKPTTSSLISQRPIATNSRIRRSEQSRTMHLSFINNALQQKYSGSSEEYDELVNQFNPKRISSDGASYAREVRMWISALSHVVSRLERQHSALVEAVLNMPWTNMDAAFVKSYTVFVGMLVSARPEYLSLVLSRIAQGFTYSSGSQALTSTLPEASSSPLTRGVVYNRLHSLLRHVISLIPTCPATLHPLLVRNFPHKRQNQVAQSTYIRNLLRITEYCDELSSKILALIVERALQIDVEIQVEIEDLEEHDASQDLDMFDLDPFDTAVGADAGYESEQDDSGGEDNFSDLSSDAGDDSDDGAENATLSINVQHIQEMISKLDSILDIVLKHFKSNYIAAEHPAPPPSIPSLLPPLPPLPYEIDSPSAPSSPYSLSADTSFPLMPASPAPIDGLEAPTPEHTQAVRRTQFHTLLSIFDRTIIRTFKSRYTQFLIFWFSSLDPEFSDLFQGMLVSKALLEEDQPTVTRAAAASYIGSFISRAKFVDREGARRVMGVLCEFLSDHLEVNAELLTTGEGWKGVTQHMIFYAVTQAVFLIFCFRWRDLLETGEEEGEMVMGGAQSVKKWMPELSVIQRVITSPLNPLKVCSPNVVMQFARVAHTTDFVYCYTILEANKRSEYNTNTSVTSNSHSSNAGPSLSSSALMNVAGINAEELNTFFPFDPYKLPKSNSFIEGIYREWSSVAIDNEDDEEEDEDEDEAEAEAEVEDIVPAGGLGIPGMTFKRPGESPDDELGTSLGAMSISPVRPDAMKAVLL